MRKKDREITDFEEIITIVDKCEVLHLGLADNGIPYIVPLNYGYKVDGEQLTFFFHSALEGRKMDIMRKNPYVCFEMETSFKITKGEVPCKWSAEHESVIGYGTISFLEDTGEKKAAMDLIMKKYGYEGIPEYMTNIFLKTAVYQLEVSQITGKRNIKNDSNDR
jgi:uncharacterized protein